MTLRVALVKAAVVRGPIQQQQSQAWVRHVSSYTSANHEGNMFSRSSSNFTTATFIITGAVLSRQMSRCPLHPDNQTVVAWKAYQPAAYCNEENDELYRIPLQIVKQIQHMIVLHTLKRDGMGRRCRSIEDRDLGIRKQES